ncbi:MAG: ATP-binding protein [Lachnospiraceae bacterium]|nr:ATP-binding protein [Lachnospiraceae bacterium]
MGYYLNSTQALTLYKSEVDSPYFVDKSLLLRELFPLVKIGNKHVCITRPRRFGKSVMAAMVASFFGRGIDSSEIFDSLKIAGKTEEADDSTGSATENSGAVISRSVCLADSLDIVPEPEKPKKNKEIFDYRDFLNRYNVIYINFIEPANLSKNYDQFIHRVENVLSRDLHREFSHVDFWDDAAPQEDMTLIHEETGEKFIFVMDEWDCIFHKNYTTDDDRRSFINWLAALTKDKAYVALTYMTGVLPIAKYSSGSTINHFDEYTMSIQPKFSEFFGFTEKEVDMLFQRYLEEERTPKITREDLKLWYDGYYTAGGDRLYNPRSVVKALSNNCLASYWTTSGSYGEIAAYIKNDRADIRKDVALMVTGEAVPTNVEEYAATAMQLTTRTEILSAMVVYGFLNYEDGKVRIPNKELMDEFAKTIREREDLGYINRLAMESDRMLEATLTGNTRTMAEILQFAHDSETPLLSYNHESELTAIVNLVYLSARDKYFVEREDKAGRGYVDFIFYPVDPGEDGIILELKVNSTPEKALQQIKDKGYVMKFRGKMADKKQRAGQIRLVGIGYSKKTKKHRCKVEVLRPSQGSY